MRTWQQDDLPERLSKVLARMHAAFKQKALINYRPKCLAALSSWSGLSDWSSKVDHNNRISKTILSRRGLNSLNFKTASSQTRHAAATRTIHTLSHSSDDSYDDHSSSDRSILLPTIAHMPDMISVYCDEPSRGGGRWLW